MNSAKQDEQQKQKMEEGNNNNCKNSNQMKNSHRNEQQSTPQQTDQGTIQPQPNKLKKMSNEYWHIPRASLASSSGASSAGSSSHRSHRSHSNPPRGPPQPAAVHGHNGRRHSELSATSAAATAAAAAAVLAAANVAPATKRGSRTSLGSTDSNHSTRSAASGSLLLTAANLERFAEIHRHRQQLHQQNLQLPRQQHNELTYDLATAATTAYNANLMHALATGIHPSTKKGDAVTITLDPLGLCPPSKGTGIGMTTTTTDVESDNISLASSMHFTMVNGDDGRSKRPKRGLCDRGRQVTVLIVSMSTIFLLLIMGMVYALEMRARVMPQS